MKVSEIFGYRGIGFKDKRRGRGLLESRWVTKSWESVR